MSLWCLLQLPLNLQSTAEFKQTKKFLALKQSAKLVSVLIIKYGVDVVSPTLSVQWDNYLYVVSAAADGSLRILHCFVVELAMKQKEEHKEAGKTSVQKTVVRLR